MTPPKRTDRQIAAAADPFCCLILQEGSTAEDAVSQPELSQYAADLQVAKRAPTGKRLLT